jgi:coronin-1B/1C/6
VERLSTLVAQLRTQVEQRDTRIRHLEAENETLKTNQARAREALLNSL